jgi:hypothetical protein
MAVKVPKQLQGAFSRLGRTHNMAPLGENPRQHPTHIFLVVDYQDVTRGWIRYL